MAGSENQDPKISIDKGETKPIIATYPENPVFNVGDGVYLLRNGSREGPFVIATVGTGKYTLSRENGEAVGNGEEIDAEYLEAA